MFSETVEAALVYASARHAGQKRKAGEVPYFVHLVHVALMLARRGEDDATLTIALLHDVLEDTTRDAQEEARVAAEIRSTWGTEVAEGVASLTEPKRGPDGARLSWRSRKEAYLAQLETAPSRALRVSAADKIHNLETLLAALRVQGPGVWERFTGGPDQSRWYYRSVVDVLDRRLGPGHGLVDALTVTIARLESEHLTR